MNTIKDCTGLNYATRPDPMAIIAKYYEPGSKAYEYIIQHGRMVANQAFELAKRTYWLPPGMMFLEEAAMLHDIGIFMTAAPHLGCTGDYPYMAHGYLGREILEREGYPLHALVCERHVGAGITAAEIREKGLELPTRDMVPITPEEEIISLADKFFPVGPEDMLTKRSMEEAREEVKSYGKRQLRRFDRWAGMYLGE